MNTAVWITRDPYGCDMYRSQPKRRGYLSTHEFIHDTESDIVFESMDPDVFEGIFGKHLEIGEQTEVILETKETPWPVTTE